MFKTVFISGVLVVHLACTSLAGGLLVGEGISSQEKVKYVLRMRANHLGPVLPIGDPVYRVDDRDAIAAIYEEVNNPSGSATNRMESEVRLAFVLDNGNVHIFPTDGCGYPTCSADFSKVFALMKSKGVDWMQEDHTTIPGARPLSIRYWDKVSCKNARVEGDNLTEDIAAQWQCLINAFNPLRLSGNEYISSRDLAKCFGRGDDYLVADFSPAVRFNAVILPTGSRWPPKYDRISLAGRLEEVEFDRVFVFHSRYPYPEYSLVRYAFRSARTGKWLITGYIFPECSAPSGRNADGRPSCPNMFDALVSLIQASHTVERN